VQAALDQLGDTTVCCSEGQVHGHCGDVNCISCDDHLQVCDNSGKEGAELILCPDGADICRFCFNEGAH